MKTQILSKSYIQPEKEILKSAIETLNGCQGL